MVETQANSENVQNKERRDTGGLFWGGLLVLLGVLFLLSNLGVIELHLANLWQLWPLVIIGVGVSFFDLRGVWGAIIKTLVILGSLGLLFFAVTTPQGLRPSGAEGAPSSVSIAAHDEIEMLELHVNTGGVSVRFDDGAPADGSLAIASISGQRQLIEKSERDGNIQRTTLELGKGGLFSGENRLTLQITQDIPVKLVFDVGATSIKGDLSQVQLSQFHVDGGAVSVDVQFGDLQERMDILVDAGASSVRLRLPKDVAYQVKYDGGLSSRSFEDAEKLDDESYETADFADADKKAVIIADVGASSFKVERY